MAKRLSEEDLKDGYDKGNLGFSLVLEPSGVFEQVNLQNLLLASDPKAAVQQVSPQQLYFSLLSQGIEDSQEILGLMSPEQFLRICDYDIWIENQLNPKRLLQWIAHFGAISSYESYQRFRQLDEECQLAVLIPYVRAYDRAAFDSMSQAQQDSLYPFPGEEFFYSIETDDKEMHGLISNLIESIMGCDMPYAMGLIAHAAYQPPNELEGLASRFRLARLEEDGFVGYDESLDVFIPHADMAGLSARWGAGSVFGSHGLVPVSCDRGLFIQQVLSRGTACWDVEKRLEIRQGFVYLGNSLCAAGRVSPADIKDIQFVFQNAQGIASFALEVLASADVTKGCEILEAEAPQSLFRFGLGLVAHLQSDVIAVLKAINFAQVSDLERYFRTQKFGLCLDWFDKNLGSFEFEQAEILKGVFNRYPALGKSIFLDGIKRVHFKPIAGVEDFRTMGLQVHSTLALLRLLADCGLKTKEFSNEKVINTFLVNSILKQRLSYEHLAPRQVEVWIAKSKAERSQLIDSFFESVRFLLCPNYFKSHMSFDALSLEGIHEFVCEWMYDRLMSIETALAEMPEQSDKLFFLVREQ